MLNDTLHSRFAIAMQRFALLEPPSILAVAVSGGSDSMALALLAHHWVKASGGRILALTVDHGLRPESADEAVSVKTWLEARGIAHHTLVWKGEKPRANIQETARKERYALLLDWCKTHHIAYLLTGHHQDDQAETVLLRLARGSGVDGLSAIPPVSYREGVCILRPCLGFSKAELRAFLQGEGQAWAEDPSNRKPDYARNALRLALDTYADAPLITKRLADTAQHMARVRDYLEHQTAHAIEACVTLNPGGDAAIRYDVYHTLHEEIAFRLLAELLPKISSNRKKPRFSDIQRLHHAIQEHRPATLHGCRITWDKSGNTFFIRRERA